MNASKCESCGYIQYHNNSCRDRCCPMCQALSNETWIDAQNEFVLDIDYFHLVFTCPEELNPLIFTNQKLLYALFFRAVAETIQELSEDPAHMGARPGFISIMHTWGANLSYHPHVHVIAMGGKDRWLLPARQGPGAHVQREIFVRPRKTARRGDALILWKL